MVIVSNLIVPPADSLVYFGENVTLKIDQTQLSAGTLYITESCLHWKPNDKDEGISIPWPKVSLHAIASTPLKCVYLMLDFSLVWPSVLEHRNGAGDGEEIDDDEGFSNVEEDVQMTEMWLVPTDVAEVDKIYASMTQCQALHPDPTDSCSDDEDFEEALDEEYVEEDLQNLNIDDDSKYADAD